jgi:hypothetical protein
MGQKPGGTEMKVYFAAKEIILHSIAVLTDPQKCDTLTIATGYSLRRIFRTRMLSRRIICRNYS